MNPRAPTADTSNSQAPDYLSRRARVLEHAQRQEAHALLVTDLVNVRYLSGFTGSNAALAVAPDQSFLITDGRYRDQAQMECPDVTIVIDRALAKVGCDQMLALGVHYVAVEADHMSVAEYRQLDQSLLEVELLATSGIVEAARRTKDPYEVAQITRACELISEAVDQLLPTIAVGQSERRIARTLESLLLDLGAAGLGFDTIVAAGANSAIPHHAPTEYAVAAGDMLKVDAGALFAGYRSDMTRTYVVGAEPTQRQQELHDAVAQAAQAARDVVAVGVTIRAADDAARTVLRQHGLEDQFTHGLGHGVGLQIHEAPMVNHNSTGSMAAADVFTIEPGAYLPGFAGVRIEDTLVVADEGSQILTTTDRQFIRLG